MGKKFIVKNKKAYFNYNILDRYEAGVVLSGAEVKSVKNHQINLSDGFVRLEDDELWLWNVEIPQYKFSDLENYDPKRSRKLLMKRREIDQLKTKLNQKGLTLIPTAVYLTRGKVKVEVGLGKGKREYEKRRKLKERDLKRELHREKRKYMIK